MAVVPKSIKKDVKQGEMEQRQNIARGYRVGPQSDKPATLVNEKQKPYLYPNNTAEEATQIAKNTYKKIIKNDKIYNYLDKVYIPLGAVGGLIAVIAGGMYLISPWITIFYILGWSGGYIVLKNI